MERTISYTNIPELQEFMENLPDIFSKEGKIIKSGRNEIKIIKYGGISLCVKSFIKISTFNRIMYSWFRSTKAKRSFQIATKLLNRGIQTPFPMGYVEVVGKGGLVRKSFYVSAFMPHKWQLNDVLKKEHPDEKRIICEYARFMAQKIHPAGVWHKDMSNGNVLINPYRNGYSFALIDLNRIRFKRKIKPFKGLRNLIKLNGKATKMTLMAEQYAMVSLQNPHIYIIRLFGSQLTFQWLRKKTKSFLHTIDPTRR